MTIYRKPKEVESPEDSAVAPHLEMEKKVITMADGKRRMIFFTFTEGKEHAHG